MSTEQPAPETDAAAEPARYFKEESQGEPSELCMVVSINFARTLERDRDAARAEAQDFRIKLIKANSTITHRELDIMALRAEATEARAELMAFVAHHETTDAIIADARGQRPEDGKALLYNYDQLRDERDALRTEVARLTNERDEAQLRAEINNPVHEFAIDMMWHHKADADALRAELVTLRDADHGAAIEVAAKACAIEFASPEWRKFARRMIRPILRALVATVTNSQQKGGDETCAPNTNQEACSKNLSILSASNAAPTSDPEGAATKAAARWNETPLPSVTETAKEIMRLIESDAIAAYVNQPDQLRRIESILSHFLGVRAHELRKLRAECERLRKDKERMDWLQGEGHDWACFMGNCDHWIPTLREAIDAAMQPKKETK